MTAVKAHSGITYWESPEKWLLLDVLSRAIKTELVLKIRWNITREHLNTSYQCLSIVLSVCNFTLVEAPPTVILPDYPHLFEQCFLELCGTSALKVKMHKGLLILDFSLMYITIVISNRHYHYQIKHFKNLT